MRNPTDINETDNADAEKGNVKDGEDHFTSEHVGKHDSCFHFPDIVFLAGWIASVVIVMALAFTYGFPSLSNLDDILDDGQIESITGTDDISNIYSAFKIPAYSFLTTVLFSIAWLVVMLLCGRFIMYLFFLVLIGGFFVATAMFWEDSPRLAFFTGIACAGVTIWGCSMRARMDFASKTLQVACHVVLEFPSIILMAIVVLCLVGAYLVFWCIAVVGMYLHIEYDIDDDEHGTTDIFLAYFILIVFFFWTAEVLKNIVMVTTMGVTADWW